MGDQKFRTPLLFMLLILSTAEYIVGLQIWLLLSIFCAKT